MWILVAGLVLAILAASAFVVWRGLTVQCGPDELLLLRPSKGPARLLREGRALAWGVEVLRLSTRSQKSALRVDDAQTRDGGVLGVELRFCTRLAEACFDRLELLELPPAQREAQMLAIVEAELRSQLLQSDAEAVYAHPPSLRQAMEARLVEPLSALALELESLQLHKLGLRQEAPKAQRQAISLRDLESQMAALPVVKREAPESSPGSDAPQGFSLLMTRSSKQGLELWIDGVDEEASPKDELVEFLRREVGMFEKQAALFVERVQAGEPAVVARKLAPETAARWEAQLRQLGAQVRREGEA